MVKFLVAGWAENEDIGGIVDFNQCRCWWKVCHWADVTPFCPFVISAIQAFFLIGKRDIAAQMLSNLQARAFTFRQLPKLFFGPFSSLFIVLCTLITSPLLSLQHFFSACWAEDDGTLSLRESA